MKAKKSNCTEASPKEIGSLNSKIFTSIEKVGNKFPHPFILFIYCILILIILSEFLKGITFTIPGDETQLSVTSLLSKNGFVYMLSNMMNNFISFPLIPIILTFTLAIGVGEQAGFYEVFIFNTFRKIPDKLLIFFFIYLSVNGNIISDAALMLLPSIGAIAFISKGKNPVLAILLCYTGYLAGLSANTIIAGTDALTAGITEGVLPLLPITRDIIVHPAINWFFMCASSFILPAVGTIIAVKITEPMLNKDTSIVYDKDINKLDLTLTSLQKKGLKYVTWTTIIYFALVLLMLIPENGWLRNSLTREIIPSSPFMSNITIILAIYFFLIGLFYGIGAKTIKSSQDVANGMAKGLSTTVPLLVVFFFAAQFINYFSYTNLASLIAIKGAKLLTELNFVGVPLIIAIIIIVSIINFFIGTVGAKWALLAPILVPMFALLGYSPAFAQCAYRIGDAVTNTINPISVYLPIILMYIHKYKKDAGIGTIIAYQLPYAISFMIVWTLQIIIWFLLDLPLGPGANIFL